MKLKVLKQGLLASLYVLSLALPGYIFASQRGGWGFFSSLGSLESGLQLLFPLFGLYAFILLANQAVIGPNTEWLGRYFVNITQWHRRQGVFGFSFALLHPLAILIGYGLSGYWHYEFVAHSLAWWTLPGYIGLSILLATAGSAIINWKFARLNWWRGLHRLNYAVFGLVWVHSWFIGSDVRTTNLKYVWLFYLTAVAVSFVYKYRQPFIALVRSRPNPTN